MKNTLLIFLVLTVIFYACRKEPVEVETDISQKTPTEMLTAHAWKLSAFSVTPAIDWDGNGYMVTDIWTNMNQCKRDDIMRFFNDGSYERNEGDSMCHEFDLQIFQVGTWSFKGNNDSLVLVPGDCNCIKPYTLKVELLDMHYFVFSYTIKTGETDYTYTESYSE
ncbi:MAG: hypothetical protein CVU05_14400 [Bacteroidetes bacterium HGW-Bacteroidetes-21]|jgi:hypothetical protein|nr:MAG: hypothetical protein CVU05_14400 [Bacteroidetes bacterium HGW-Bacteroidetes-21]